MNTEGTENLPTVEEVVEKNDFNDSGEARTGEGEDSPTADPKEDAAEQSDDSDDQGAGGGEEE